MNYSFLTIPIVMFLFLSAFFYNNYKINEKINNNFINSFKQNQQIEVTQIQLIQELNSLNEKLKIREILIDTHIATIKANITLINNSIDSDKKRWERIKLVQQAIKNTLPENHPYPDCRNKPTPATIIQIATAVIDISDRYGVNPALTLAIIRRESAFCNEAISKAGARGLMQLMPSTARDQITEIGAALKIYTIRDNIHLGVYYISKRLIDFDGNEDLALKAYNAGAAHVLKVISGEKEDFYKEPKDYARIVLMYKEEYQNIGVQ